MILCSRSRKGRAARWSPVLAERGTLQMVYPVAKNNSIASGSNKFCLAVLVGCAHV
ncbi:hypothetical protein [Petrachloros mirabilis]